MPGLDPGIHAFLACRQDVDGRVKPGHDGEMKPYGVIVTGEKSTNQLLACTKPLILGLSARGPTS
jgi:hypothetical protein